MVKFWAGLLSVLSQLTQPNDGAVQCYYPILHKRHRKVRNLAQGHIADKW